MQLYIYDKYYTLTHNNDHDTLIITCKRTIFTNMFEVRHKIYTSEKACPQKTYHWVELKFALARNFRVQIKRSWYRLNVGKSLFGQISIWMSKKTIWHISKPFLKFEVRMISRTEVIGTQILHLLCGGHFI